MKRTSRIWIFHHLYSVNETYAQADAKGGLRHPPIGFDSSGLLTPLILEWEPGSNMIGDFTIASPWHVIVTEQVARDLIERFKGFVLGTVEFYQLPKFDKIKRPKIPRVMLPYQGPKLYYLYPEKAIPLDLSRSSLIYKEIDDTRSQFDKIEGVEHIELQGQFPNLKRARIPRVEGKGLFVWQRDIIDADMFRINLALSRVVYCNDAMKDFIEKSGYTNVDFLEMGDVLAE